jgi:hypothetical protein
LRCHYRWFASPFAIPALWVEMVGAARNAGWRGICACAISAIDVALWDLKSRLLDVPVSSLLGHCRDSVPIYGSGGSHRIFGALPERDLERVKGARAAIGSAGLYVDANGAYQRKEALTFARQFAELGVIWFEEPVSSDDLEGLRLLRDRAPPGLEIAAGEYGYEPFYFRRMLEAGAVDVLQADATRCGGHTGFLKGRGTTVARCMTARAKPRSGMCARRHLPWPRTSPIRLGGQRSAARGAWRVPCSINFYLTTEKGVSAWRHFLYSAAGLVVKHGGSLSGEHGDGKARARRSGIPPA